MIIYVDFYKPGGKWYTGGEVDIGDAKLWKGDLKQAIVDRQDMLVPDWMGHYHVVTSSLPESDKDRNYSEFFEALFLRESFEGMKKS